MIADDIASRICSRVDELACENVQTKKATEIANSKDMLLEDTLSTMCKSKGDANSSLKSVDANATKAQASQEAALENPANKEAIATLIAPNFEVNKALIHAEDVTSTLLDKLGCGVVQMSLGFEREESTLIWANEAYYRLLGLSQEDFEKQGIFNKPKLFIHPDDLSRFYNYYELRHKTDMPLRIQFRLLHSSGRYIWVDARSVYAGHDESENPILISMLFDITAEHKLIDTLESNGRIDSLISEFSDQLIFEYDRTEDSLHRIGSSINSRVRGIHNNILISKNFLKEDIYRGFICPEDIPAINNLLMHKTIVDNEKPEEVKFRILNREHEYIWHTCSVMSYVDLATNHIKVIGKIVNNHHNEIRLKRLMESNKIDTETNLFNELTMVRRCSALLSLEGDISHALIVIEIDRFELLEQSYGIVFAHDVICKVAKALQNTFRKSDYIAHIHGKSFAVLAKDSNEDMAFRLCKKLLSNLEKASVDLAYNYRPSLSIGVAVYPDAAWNFDKLRCAATKALEEGQANNHKGAITIYQPTNSEENRAIALKNYSKFEQMLDEATSESDMISHATAYLQDSKIEEICSEAEEEDKKDKHLEAV